MWSDFYFDKYVNLRHDGCGNFIEFIDDHIYNKDVYNNDTAYEEVSDTVWKTKSVSEDKAKGDNDICNAQQRGNKNEEIPFT